MIIVQFQNVVDPYVWVYWEAMGEFDNEDKAIQAIIEYYSESLIHPAREHDVNYAISLRKVEQTYVVDLTYESDLGKQTIWNILPSWKLRLIGSETPPMDWSVGALN